MTQIRDRGTDNSHNLEDVFLELTGASELHNIIQALRTEKVK
jgi:hypothetical protein